MQLDPADEHQAQQHRQRKAGVGGVEAEGVVQRVGHSVGLQAVEGKAEGHQQQERHDHPQPALVQAVLDVIRRATTVGAFSVGAFVQLAEGALDKARRHAHQRGDPHPEHGTRATQSHGNADTGDITGTHAARQAEHQRLERTELAGAALEAVFKHREHVEKVTQLHETRADREITAEPDYEHDQYFPERKSLMTSSMECSSLIFLMANAGRSDASLGTRQCTTLDPHPFAGVVIHALSRCTRASLPTAADAKRGGTIPRCAPAVCKGRNWPRNGQ